MAEEDCNGRKGTVAAEGEVAGQKYKITNIRVMDLVLVVLVLWSQVVQPYLDKEHVSVKESTEHAQIIQGIKEIVYVLSLEPDERKQLQLAMPESLRKPERAK
jgi:hypothetical protein